MDLGAACACLDCPLLHLAEEEVAELLNVDALVALVREDESENIVEPRPRRWLKSADGNAVLWQQALLNNRANRPLLPLERRVGIVGLRFDVVGERRDKRLGCKSNGVHVDYRSLCSHALLARRAEELNGCR